MIMVLTGAERQRRYRDKLLATVRGDDLGQRARDTMDEAVATLWAILKRPLPDGQLLADGDDFADLDAYRCYWAEQLQSGEAVEPWISAYFDDATEDERSVLKRAIELANAVRLAHVEIPAKAKRRSRTR